MNVFIVIKTIESEYPLEPDRHEIMDVWETESSAYKSVENWEQQQRLDEIIWGKTRNVSFDVKEYYVNKK